MANKYALLCMSFDGEIKLETDRGEGFESIEKAWEWSEYIGSKWYFFPFHFVVTITGKTIIESPYILRHHGYEGKRVKTIREIFRHTSRFPESNGLESESYSFLLPFIG